MNALKPSSKSANLIVGALFLIAVLVVGLFAFLW